MGNSRKICVEPTADKAIALATELTKTIICESVDHHQSCFLALSGGTTPQPMYQKLASAGMIDEVPWSDVEIFFGDERHVSQDNAECNYHMAQRTMLDNLPIEPDKIHPMRGDSQNIEQAVEEYEQTVRRIVPAGPNKIPRFDLILLGMGGDGHVASLFAGTDAENEQNKLVVATFVPVLNRMRLTFSFPLINAARNVMFLICGNDKAEAVGALLNDDLQARNRLAGAKVNPTDGQLIFVLDSAAARLIKS
jgi:6-phosphogluconolactonase